VRFDVLARLEPISSFPASTVYEGAPEPKEYIQ
jgi:hypothetical protein